MKKFLKKHMIAILFAVTGAVAGLLYWKFVGCKSGTCPIKSNWYLMTLYGVVLGYLVGDMVSGWINKGKRKKEQEG